MPWPPIRYATWPLDGEWEDHAVYRLAEEYQREEHRRYHVAVRYPSEKSAARNAAIVAARTETTTPPGGALDNPSAPRIVEGMRCPGCKRNHTVEVVYGSVSHAGKTWARAVYTCVCCEWHDVRGQR